MSSLTYDYSVPGIIGVTDANGATTEYQFTDDGALLQVTDPLNQLTSFAYDVNGNITEVTSPDNTTYQFTYDGENRILTQTNPLNQTITYAYGDNSDSPEVVTDEQGNPINFTYDEQGKLTEIGYADGTSKTYVYDETGLLIEETDRSGDTFEYIYDQRGRLIEKRFDDGTSEQYSYDSDSNIVSLTDINNGVTTLTRDAESRITQIDYSDGRSLSYTYDTEGRRANMIDQDGFEVNYHYDNQNQLTSLTNDVGETLVTYEYDAVGRLVQETNGNGTFTTYNYDEAGQVTEIINYAEVGVINSSFAYIYDNLGKRISEVTTDGTWSYTYDDIGQLTQAHFDSTNPNIGDQDLEYVYDDAGNRVQTTINGVVSNYTSNNLNQYTNVAGADYTYDADGNLIQVIDGADIYNYTYNDDNRLIEAETPEGIWEYEYNVFGDLTVVIENGVRTEYLIDPLSSLEFSNQSLQLDSVVGEYDDNSQLVANYAHGLGLTVRFDSNGDYYFDSDAVGSINGLTDDSGSYINQYVYQPFGEVLDSVEGVNNSFQFVGELGVMNDSSGLYFMRERQYDPITGRFITPDPLDLNGGNTNLYEYGFNDPETYIDPEGLFWPLVGAFLVGVAASLVAAYIYDQLTGDDPPPQNNTTINNPTGPINIYNGPVTINTPVTPPSPPSPPPPPPVVTPPQKSDPLVFDLDGDGIELISLNDSTTFFDVNANGFREFTSWISADDGFLALDANHDGVINDISELFGDQSTNGFQDLATLDTNADNGIDANDTLFNDLRIWIDRDENGITDIGELRTLAQWEIQSISLDYTNLDPNGDIISTGNFTYNDNSQGEIAAIALDVSFVNTVYNLPVELKAETAFLPNLKGFGQLPDLNIAMSLDSELLAQMRELVQLGDQDLEQLPDLLENLMYQWAGVQDMDPNSGSEFFDARQQAFLEKFFQQPIDFEITNIRNATGLRQSWADITNAFTSRLAAQSFMRDLFSESTYNPNTNSFTTEANLDDLLVKIQDNLPTKFVDSARYWSYAIGVLDAHEGRFNLSKSEYNNTLTTALGSDLSPYLAALRNHYFGGQNDDYLRLLYYKPSFLDGGSGNDTINGGRKDDLLSGGLDHDVIIGDAGNDFLSGGAGNDDLFGNPGDDILQGDKGQDNLFGNLGDDELFGGAGDDKLQGGKGDDSLWGNLGNDTFVLKVGHSTDIIFDFISGEDLIGLKGLTFSDLTINSNTSTEIIDTGSNEILAILQGITSLAASDFVSV